MYAVIESGGLQFKIAVGERVILPRLEAKEGDKINFPRVLFLSQDGKIEVGRPYLDKVKVEAEVLRNFKGRKLISFRYQRRENYERKKGFRAELSEVKITDIKGG
jgi:large subunit ribosomal protein L21